MLKMQNGVIVARIGVAQELPCANLGPKRVAFQSWDIGNTRICQYCLVQETF
jgi:hypothetical protein